MTENESALKPARRQPASGRRAVGDYVGQRAEDAAKDVRQAGLRPGLERSFGCAEELRGLVVAQDPTPGSSLGRNSLVTLHIAAPGIDPTGADTDTGSVEPSTSLPRHSEDQRRTSGTGSARRRKPGARRATSGRDDPAPPPFRPVPAPRSASGERDAASIPTPLLKPLRESESTECLASEGSLDALEERECDAAARDEFVVSAEDLFAGRDRWRWAYSRTSALRRRGVSRGRLGGHRRLTVAVSVGVAAWLLVALSSVIGGHSGASSPAAQKVSGPVRHLGRAPKVARPARSRRASVVRRSRFRGAQPHRASNAGLRRRPSVAAVTETVAPVASTGSEVVPQDSAPAQSRVGPFSP
jgi:PASTA domain